MLQNRESISGSKPSRSQLLVHFTVFCSLLVFLLQTAQARQKMQLKEPVEQRLESVIAIGLELQQSLVQQQEDRVQMKLTELQKASSDLISIAGANPQAHTHLIKLVTHLEGQLRTAQKNTVEERPGFLKEVFKSLVEMVRSYQMPKAPRIFFCNKDKSEWIQTSWAAQNPISVEEHPKCGVPAG